MVPVLQPLFVTEAVIVRPAQVRDGSNSEVWARNWEVRFGIAGLNPQPRFLEVASGINLYCSIHYSLDLPMKSDCSIGDRVQMSALGASRYPRRQTDPLIIAAVRS